MEDKKIVADEQLEKVSGGAFDPKKSMIRNLYDEGSSLDKQLEKGIVKLEKSVADLLHPDKK